MFPSKDRALNFELNRIRISFIDQQANGRGKKEMRQPWLADVWKPESRVNAIHDGYVHALLSLIASDCASTLTLNSCPILEINLPSPREPEQPNLRLMISIYARLLWGQ